MTLHNYVTRLESIVTLQDGKWIRGRRVEIQGEDLYCELAVDRPCSLVDSYSRDPHIQFLNCETDEDIQRFVRAWGPLYLKYGDAQQDELRQGAAVRSLKEYRADLRRFKAVKGLVDAAKGNRDERSSLIEFILADEEDYRLSPLYRPESLSSMHFSLQLWLCPQSDLMTWVRTCSTADVRRALAFCVECEVTAPWPGGLKVLPHKNRLRVVPSYRRQTLNDAMRGMVWFDEWNAWPPVACSDCHKVFRPLTHHKRKYCSSPSAHRTVVRNWRKKREARRRSLAKSST